MRNHILYFLKKILNWTKINSHIILCCIKHIIIVT